MRKLNNLFSSNIFLLALVLILALISMAVGVLDFNLVGMIKGNASDQQIGIISRFPRTASIIITGMGLSISGLIMQSISNNKFVSPTTAGTMDWCKLGILVSIIFFGSSGIAAKIAVSFIFGLGGSFLFLKLLEKIKLKNKMLVPLIGMMLGSVVEAITLFFGYNLDILQNIQSWTQGSFSLITQGRYELLYLGIPFLIVAFIYADNFTVAGMGKTISSNLGLNYEKIVAIGLMIVALITSTIIVTVGSIPFVGLIVPNLISLWHGDNIKSAIPKTIMLGSIFMLVSDIIGRIIIFPYEISISAVAAVIGSFIFIIILLKNRQRFA